MPTEPESLRFASEATITALWGGFFLLLAAIAMWRDVSRARRKNVDRVGLVPWTKVFFLCLFPGVILLAMAVKGWVSAG